MHKKIFTWLGREFIELAGEAKPAANATVEAQELFGRFDGELRAMDCPWTTPCAAVCGARPRQPRLGQHRASEYLVRQSALGKLQLYRAGSFRLRRQSGGRSARHAALAAEHAKASSNTIRPSCRSVSCLRFRDRLSGVTTVLPTLAEQFDNIFPRIAGSLKDAGSSWDKVARVSFYVHRSQTLENLKTLFTRHVTAKIPQMEYCFVDGYSSEGKFCEVEVTAQV